MKLIIFSICKDEAATIGELLDRIPKTISGIDEIQTLVISDGSTDDTVKIAKKHGAEVIDGKRQRRLAYRFSQALDWVLSNGADFAVNIDGDLQFKPEDIPKIAAPVIRGEADFVAADRFTDEETGKQRRPKNMPPAKYWGNRMGAFVVSKLSSNSFRDVTCGFRAYNRKSMLALNLNTQYTYTQESFQILAVRGFEIASVPVEVKYYPGRKSRVVTNFMQFMISSALNVLRAFRDFAPLKFFFWLGLPPFTAGFLSVAFVGIHWLQEGAFSPYKFLGIAGVYLLSIGFILWALGAVADMYERMMKNQEKTMELLKDIKYRKTDDK
ncbi:MAG: glycosyltransferase family 2 protein [Candidatus Saccharimonadales bacterium]|nr:glycosyltransferase family 2 protein [Candidatus Saccharimonadales bacterium]